MREVLFILQVQGGHSAEDQLSDIRDQLKSLNGQLTQAENLNNQWEAEVGTSVIY